MSRRDIAVILERLSLDHRTSLADKACAYLQAAEFNGAIKNHPSHAAICVDIAADQLSIEVSRQVLVRLSGAPSPSEYSNTLQKLSRLLTGKSRQHDQETLSTGSSPTLDVNLTGDPRHSHMRQLISSTSQTYLRQLAIQYGSMELDGLALDCLERFFEVWVKSLSPAQRVHVKYSDPKWVGAAFWLCAMARNMTVSKVEEMATAEGGAKAKVAKRIGGRGGKELKETILTAIEHKVKKPELDNTIRLIEDTVLVFLMSLRKPKGGVTGGSGSTPSTPRKRRPLSDNDSSTSSLIEIVIPIRGGAEVQRPGQPKKSERNGDREDGEDDENPFIVKSAGSTTSELRGINRQPDAYRTMGTKRQISNVSQMSLVSDADDVEEQGNGQETSGAAARSAKPPSKRKRLDPSDIQLSSADITSLKKGTPRKGLKEATAASQDAGRLLNQRRKTGGVYSMIPRVKYENTRASALHKGIRIATDMEKAATSQNAAVTTPEAITDVTPGNTHLILWGLAEEYIDQARSLCFIATTQPSSQPAWRKRHQDLIFCAIKCLAACVSLESPSMTQLDRAKTGLRLAQILFDETESLDRCEEEVNKAIQGSTALDIQLRLYDLQIQIYIQSKKFRLAKTILGTASTEAAT
ncbi:hypothetical protein BGZ58_004764 [Dissophora ornata]|nr:hypothetical protein BGZ58_004764 [Dissophora ornata]